MRRYHYQGLVRPNEPQPLEAITDGQRVRLDQLRRNLFGSDWAAFHFEARCVLGTRVGARGLSQTQARKLIAELSARVERRDRRRAGRG